MMPHSMNDKHVISFNFYLSDCLPNVTIDEATGGFLTFLPDLYSLQEVGAKSARDKDIDDASFLTITLFIKEDEHPYFFHSTQMGSRALSIPFFSLSIFLIHTL